MSSTSEPDNALLQFVLAHPHRPPASPTSFMDEIIPGLYLGSYEAAENIAGLRAHGVTHILSVLKWAFDKPPDGFTTLRILLDDSPWADIALHFDQTIAFIDSALSPAEVDGAQQPSGGILVHCAAGVSRSATVVTAYLMAKRGMTSSEALEYVRQRRPCVEPNIGFTWQLNVWHKAGCVYWKDARTLRRSTVS